MNQNSHLLSRAHYGLLSLSIMSLAACGGGGGSSESTSLYDGPSAAVAINDDNAENLAGAVYDSIIDLNSIDESFRELSRVAEVGADNVNFDLIDYLKARTLDMINQNRQSLSSTLAYSESETVECSGGGNVSYSASYASYDTETVGDRMSITYNDCRDGTSGPVINGKLSMTVAEVQGYPWHGETWALTFDTNFEYLKVTGGATKGLYMSDGGVTDSDFFATYHGGMRFKISETPDQETMNVSGKEFTVASSIASVRQRNFEQYLNYRFIDNSWESVRGHNTTVASTLIGGEVIVTTVEDFVTTGSDWYPSSGQLLIKGAIGSKLRITAQDGEHGTVLLEWDSNGDGTYDGTTETHWDDLTDLLI